MYMLSDFFIATEDELRAMDVEHSPVLCLPTVVCRGVGIIELHALEAIMAGMFHEEPSYSPDLGWTPLGAKDQNPCSLRVPTPICKRLATATDEDIEGWARAWASKRDWIAAGLPPVHLAALMRELGRLERQAQATGRLMFVWLCELPRCEY